MGVGARAGTGEATGDGEHGGGPHIRSVAAPSSRSANFPAVKIFVVGAGQVGSTIVESLHDEHDITVIDLDRSRLNALSHHYDVATVEGNGASRHTLQDAGLPGADLFIACTSRDEVNIIASMFSKKLSPGTKTIVRTTNEEYLDVWRERQLDVDWVVSSERETALAISRIIGVPAAKLTDVFAEGQVQIVEFDVEPAEGRLAADLPLSDAAAEAAERRRVGEVIGRPLREANLPPEDRKSVV